MKNNKLLLEGEKGITVTWKDKNDIRHEETCDDVWFVEDKNRYLLSYTTGKEVSIEAKDVSEIRIKRN